MMVLLKIKNPFLFIAYLRTRLYLTFWFGFLKFGKEVRFRWFKRRGGAGIYYEERWFDILNPNFRYNSDWQEYFKRKKEEGNKFKAISAFGVKII